MNIVQSWSGGKDSTLSAFLHLERGDNVTMVCCIPYFNETIPLISKRQVDFILESSYRFQKLGAKVDIIRGMTYIDYCSKPISRGFNKNLPVGYPLFMKNRCGFMRECKKYPIDKYLKSIPSDSILDISYTVDENRGALKDNEMSLLREKGYDKYKVFEKAKELKLLSPIYETNGRDGCLLCPNGKCTERYTFFNDYPSTFELLYELQYYLKLERPNIYPLWRKHYFIEDEYFVSPNGSKISLFGATIN